MISGGFPEEDTVRLGGIQKMTLLDFPGRVACTVFTVGCNFRCPFCHNASLVTHPAEDALDTEEFFAFLDRRRGLLEGVAVTGGEPFAQPDILDFFRQIRARGFAVKADTNGSYPDRLRQAVEEKLLDYVAMDIKNSPGKYAATAGLPAMPDGVKESAAFLLGGTQPFEFRTTVVDELHEPADFSAIGEWLAGEEAFFLQPFIDSGNLIGEGLHPPKPEKMQACLAALREKIPAAQLRGI